MDAIKLLDKAKMKLGSDAEVARALGLKNSNFLGHVRAKRNKLSPYMAAQLAEIVGEEWLGATIEALQATAGRDQEGAFWLKKLRALGMVAEDGIEPPTRGFSIPCSTD